MNTWTIFGKVLTDDANQIAYVIIKAAGPPVDGHGAVLAGTPVQLYVDVPPAGAISNPEAVLAYQLARGHANTFVRLNGYAPGGGVFLLPPPVGAGQ